MSERDGMFRRVSYYDRGPEATRLHLAMTFSRDSGLAIGGVAVRVSEFAPPNAIVATERAGWLVMDRARASTPDSPNPEATP